VIYYARGVPGHVVTPLGSCDATFGGSGGSARQGTKAEIFKALQANGYTFDSRTGGVGPEVGPNAGPRLGLSNPVVPPASADGGTGTQSGGTAPSIGRASGVINYLLGP
jgi:hypothetical protein